MPLSVNVGLSRKASQNFRSADVSTSPRQCISRCWPSHNESHGAGHFHACRFTRGQSQ